MNDNIALPGVDKLPYPPADATVLYRFYDASGALLYVGITNSMAQRFKAHETFAAWMCLAVSVKLEHFDRRVDAAAAEIAAIKSEKPAWNVAHANDRPAPARYKEPAEYDAPPPGAPVPIGEAANELGIPVDTLRGFERKSLIRTTGFNRTQAVDRDALEVLRYAYQFEQPYRNRALENVRTYNRTIYFIHDDIGVEKGWLAPRSGPEREAWFAKHAT